MPPPRIVVAEGPPPAGVLAPPPPPRPRPAIDAPWYTFWEVLDARGNVAGTYWDLFQVYDAIFREPRGIAWIARQWASPPDGQGRAMICQFRYVVGEDGQVRESAVPRHWPIR